MKSTSFKKEYLLVFFSIVAITLLYAGYTDHRWEDWYITYRASKNLATGHGLTFTVGEHVYSYTSIIGTVLPSFLNFITGNASDEYVIWLFRIVNAVFLGFTGVMLLKIAESKGFTLIAKILLIVLFATNILIIDFSINGMETAFMMFFVTSLLSVLLIPNIPSTLKLGFILTGLVYTRPDAFIYAGTLLLGFFIFQPLINDAVKNRFDFFKFFLKPICIAIIAYLPWLIWAWSYYGSPIPNTITAKGALQHHSIHSMLIDLYNYPFNEVYLNDSISRMFFLPPYIKFGGFHTETMILVFPGLLSMFYFFSRYGKKEVRAISLGIFFQGFYLETISGQGPMPWYVPNVGISVILVLCILFNYLSRSGFFTKRVLAIQGIAALAIVLNLFIFCRGAYELKTQQQVIEIGNRKVIGLWLKDHAQKGDKVFLECLGYIGFYSNLKMYDFPGMSSPEVVNARKETKQNRFGPVINKLKPTWVILRPHEINDVGKTNPGVLDSFYKQVQVFDVTDKVPPHLKGREYLMFDTKFILFHIKDNTDTVKTL